MEYVYLSMISGYEETKVLGVYTELSKALEVAENTLKDEDFAYSSDFFAAYVVKAEVNGDVVSYFSRDKNNGEILQFCAT
ncbi:MAG: hypothetical protein MJ170_02885 [Alphaproteobacteria bacterium]|nr:hypothetical protein [Alphaproteobacteria bacterium]